jgi:hypothetical protein
MKNPRPQSTAASDINGGHQVRSQTQTAGSKLDLFDCGASIRIRKASKATACGRKHSVLCTLCDSEQNELIGRAGTYRREMRLGVRFRT